MPPRLTPGENHQVQRNLLALHQRKEHQPEPVDEQRQPQPDVLTPIRQQARRRQTLKRRGGRVSLPRGQTLQCRTRGAQEDSNLEPENRARIPVPASVNPENAVALDLHEPDPETMWSSDLGWVPKSILLETRKKEVTKLQQFFTYEEVPQAGAIAVTDISGAFLHAVLEKKFFVMPPAEYRKPGVEDKEIPVR